MDDRDFIYWLHGIFEFGSFDTFKTEQVDLIIENICDVYESFQKSGVINDFDSMRIISFIEGALMYYDDAPIEYKVKTTTLIKNEVYDVYSRFRDNEEQKTPLFKRPPLLEMHQLEFFPYPSENQLTTKQVKKLSTEETKSILSLFDSIFKKESAKTLPAEEKMIDDGPQKSEEDNDLMDLFGGVSDEFSSEPEPSFDDAVNEAMAEESMLSLDAIAEKISARA